MIKLKKIFISIFISVLLINESIAVEENIYNKIDLFGEVLNKVKKEYVDEVDQSKIMDAAINGVLQSLIPLILNFSKTCSDKA